MTANGPPPDPQPPGSASEPATADEQLAAERAGVAYWRSVAHQRRVEAARVQRRPLVRAAIALDRRTATLQDAARRRARRARSGAEQANARARGWANRATLGSRQANLDHQLGRLPALDAPESGDLDLTLVVVGSHRATAGAHDGVAATVVAATAAEVDAAVAGSTTELIGVVDAHVGAADPSWARRLVAAVAEDPDRRAATPVTLHPRRRWRDATPDDLTVREAGLTVGVDPDGGPVLEARLHGTELDVGAASTPVVASGTTLIMGRRAFEAAGGLGTDADLAVGLIDLCLRHRARGGTLWCIADAVAIDGREVAHPDRLRSPLEHTGPSWRRLVDRHGPALLDAAGHGPEGPGLRIAITTATPSAKMAPRSGDWHYAGLLARALRAAGHEVRRQTIDQADAPVGRSADLHLVLRGLEPVRRTPGQAHVLWVISHPEALEVAECDAADLVVVASERYAAHLRTQTSTPVEVLLQATDPTHFRPTPTPASSTHRVTVVANSRGVARSAVADAIEAGLRPAVYGTGWDGLVDPGTVLAPYVPFDELPDVYSNSGVVLNDHWETMRHWGFVSNRLFDVAACATPVVSDALAEIEDLFGDLIPTWRTPEDLRATVEAIEADPEATRARVESARDLVLGHHTFGHRVEELTGYLARHLPHLRVRAPR